MFGVDSLPSKPLFESFPYNSSCNLDVLRITSGSQVNSGGKGGDALKKEGITLPCVVEGFVYIRELLLSVHIC